MTTRNKNSLKAVLFDMDGTIFDTELFSQRAVRMAFEEYSKEVLDDDEMRAYQGLHYHDRFTHMLAMRGLDDDTLIAQLSKRAHEFFIEEHNIHHSLVPGAREYIQQLHADGFTLALVSSAPRALILSNLEETQLKHYFSIITGAEDARIRKPHPIPYEQTLEQLGLAANEAIAFEDSPTGVESAWLAGLPVIGLLTTFPAEDLAKTIKTIRDYTELSIDDMRAVYKQYHT